MHTNRKTRVIVGMSGGVDSSVAAALLLERGYEVIGMFMKNWEEDDDETYCAAAADLEDARNVCERLGIPLHAVNFAAEYWNRVFAHFLAEYEAGRTPNPDVLCNKEIKFKAFLDKAVEMEAHYIATGHYARIARDGETCRLLKGRDHDKDQSYFLYTLGQRELNRSLFPLGDLTKPEVRERARQLNLVTHDKKDSTGICFIGERRFKDFLARYLPGQPGDIRSAEGRVVGRHHGLMFHTIGQRHGLGIGGPGEAWYVVGKDLEHNVLVVAQGPKHPALFHPALTAGDLHWVNGAPADTFTCNAKIRYRQADQACTVTLEAGAARVAFDEPQRAVAPGQSVVFYHGDECLGGGVIQRPLGGGSGASEPKIQ
jgi:tRNA-specific 2-thiouridylase